MAPAVRYVLKAAFSTSAETVCLEQPGQTAILRVDTTHTVRVAVVTRSTAVCGQCLVAYSWDPSLVTLEVNQVAYWRAPVPLLHGDTVIVRAVGAASTGNAAGERCFHVEVSTTAAVVPDAVAAGAPPPLNVDRPQQAEVTAPTEEGTPNATAQALALWHNYYWHHYNVAPHSVGLARHTAYATHAAAAPSSVDEWVIEELLRRHGVAASPTVAETSPCAHEPSVRCADAPPYLVVSHIMVDEPGPSDGAGTPSCAPSNAESARCCGVCPLQRRVRAPPCTGCARDEDVVRVQHLVDQLRARAADDGLTVPVLASPPVGEKGGAPHSEIDAGGSATADTDKGSVAGATTAMSPWEAYVQDRMRVATEREQQANERARKRFEKNGESGGQYCSALQGENREDTRLAELERALTRIAELEYVLSGPHYV